MAGKWHLNYTRGVEVASIGRDGSYTITGKAAPAFTLTILAWDKKSSTAEVAKDVPGAGRRQIEYLVVSRDAMKGHVKHDGRPLLYTRTLS